MGEREVNLFEEGVKPAILVKKGDIYDKYLEGREIYPYLELPVRKEIIYFQNLKGLSDFAVRLVGEMDKLGEKVLNSDSKMLGDTLGYPPLATEAWEKYFIHDFRKKFTRAVVNYYGMEFYCLPEDVEGCIEWLEEHRPVPETISSEGKVEVKYM